MASQSIRIFITIMLCLLTIRRCTCFSTLQHTLQHTTLLLGRHGQQRSCLSTSTQLYAANYLENLNNAQVEAVTQPLEGITRVVAGPGAGKTKVLTCRIAHLLQEDSTSRILAVTFTKKASGEMGERLKKIIQDEEGGDKEEMLFSDNNNGLVEEGSVGSMPNGLERVNLGTFHSICAKILRWNGKQLATLPSVQKDMVGSINAANLDASFAILDQGDQLRVMKDALKTVGVDLQKEKDLKAQTILNALGKIKAGKVDPKEVRKSRALSIAKDIYPLYREQLLASNSLDFDDLIYMTAELLHCNETIRQALRRRWPHVLVDEFQDTSEVQLDLVKMWTSDSLLVVGDADQSIYSWRGAHVESMSDFGSAFPNVHTVYLMENYRSTTNIVRAAQKVISGSESSSAAAIRQDMKPMRGTGPSPRVLACATGKAEASYVVKSILGMIGNEEIRGDQTVAVLYRTNAQSRSLEEACVANNLPYAVRGSAGAFYKRAEIKDCLCFLRWIHNGRDQSAMLRAFKTPGKGLGDKSVQEFQDYCRGVDEAYAEQNIEDRPSPLDLLIAMTDDRVSIISEAPTPDQFISNRAMNRLKEFSMQMSAIRKRAYRESVSELMNSVIETLGLEAHYDAISKTASEFADRWSNVQELRQAAERYTKGGAAMLPPGKEEDDMEDAPLLKFLDDVALVTDMAEEDESRDPEKKVIKANLMTIHASKGMEFDVVFLVGNEDGTFPTNQAVQEGDGSVALDEERRLCYVAMTRAKNNLIMTWRREVSFFQGDSFRTAPRERSRFLDVLVAKKGKGTEGSPPQGRIEARKSSSAARSDPREQFRSGSRNLSSTARLNPSTKGPINVDLQNMSKKLDTQLKRVNSNKEGIKGVGEIRAILGHTPPMGNTRKKVEVLKSSQSTPRSRSVARPKERKEPDSTWFFPVGSSVVHLAHGPGTILQPPPDKDGEMMVRVRFQAGKQVDLPAMTKELFPN